MFLIIKKAEVSDNLSDFLAEKCKIQRGDKFIFDCDYNQNWGEITSEIGQDVHEFFDSKFIYTQAALDFIEEEFNDPIRAAAQFCNETGWDAPSLNASIVASHFFNEQILNELYSLAPTEKDFLYQESEFKLINHNKGYCYELA